MYRTDYLGRTALINERGQVYTTQPGPVSHAEHIKNQLKKLGVSKYALLKSESRYLSKIIHPGEKIGGVVYGHAENGFAILVATDLRVIFLDKKPLFISEDEINYFVVSGVTLNHSSLGARLTLHTRIKDYAIRTYNVRCAKHFVEFIETRCLENIHSDGLLDQINVSIRT